MKRAISHLPQSNQFFERWMNRMVWSSALLVSGLFFSMAGWLVIKGIGGIDFGFLFSSPQQFGTAGGILPMLVSTFLILVVALVTSLPLSLATALMLSEFSRRSRYAFVVERGLIVLAAVPSIVFGLFGNALFCNVFGLGYSIWSGGLTLACMILPILIRSIQVGLESVPNSYRAAAMALGMSKTSTVWSILLPAAAPGLIVGLVLGIGRVLAETAALLFTSGFVDRMPESLSDSGRTLSIHIFELSMNVPGGEPNAYATTLVLLVILLVVNFTAFTVTDRVLRRKVSVF